MDSASHTPRRASLVYLPERRRRAEPPESGDGEAPRDTLWTRSRACSRLASGLPSRHGSPARNLGSWGAHRPTATAPSPSAISHHTTRQTRSGSTRKTLLRGALLPPPEYDVRAAPHTSPDSHIVCCDELRQGRRLSFRSRSLCNILVLKFMFYAMPPRASSGTKVASLFTSPCTLLMIPSAPLLLCIPNANP